ncbi:N-acetylmuramic acid 6-phosphate etherase [Microbacterium tumbae]
MTTVRPTEQRNPETVEIDLVPAEDAVAQILSEDAHAVRIALGAASDIARVAERTRSRIAERGRLHYFGAGASGRLAVLDATELTPTYGTPPGEAVAHFPGGVAALIDSTIDLEDGYELGRTDAAALTAGDVAIGVTASGTTPYVEGALRKARESGAYTVLITCNPSSGLAVHADDVIALDTGAEAITGSTRLKAGTATKVVLNALSTVVMVGLGRTYSNLMIGMSVTNDKLRERAVAILAEATGADEEQCRTALAVGGNDIPRTLVAMLSGVDDIAAGDALRRAGTVRGALDAIRRMRG